MKQQQDQDGNGGAFEGPMYSRTPGRDVLGKLDSSIPEVRVPHQARLDGEMRAHELGMDLTALIREIYYEALYGAKHVASMYEQRMLRASGKAGQAPQDEGGDAAVPRFLRPGA